MKSQTIISKTIITGLITIGLASQCFGETSYCFEEAANEFGMSPLILWGISKGESGHNPTAFNRNTDGSYDYSHMQINSSWYPILGKERWNALSDPCQATRTGAWILSGCIRQYGYTWDAVGCYNSRTPSKRDRYARKIAKILGEIKHPAPSTVAPKQQATPTAKKDELTQLIWGQNSDATITR